MAKARGSSKKRSLAALRKVATGIQGFDEITFGGLPKGRPTLIAGAAGCGKTLFSVEFLVRGAVRYGEPGVMLAFEENADELKKNFASLGFDLQDLIDRNLLAIDHVAVERREIRRRKDALVDRQGSVFTLRGTDEAYRVMVENMNEGAMTVDPNGAILCANARLSTMLAVSPASLVGSDIHEFVSRRERSTLDEILGRGVSGETVHRDVRLRRGTRGTLPVYLSCAPLTLDGRTVLCVIAMDLTEREAAERKLRKLNTELERKVRTRTAELEQLTQSLEEQVARRTQQVRGLSKALTVAEQRERLRLSLILHEDLQQILFSARMQLALLDQQHPIGA